MTGQATCLPVISILLRAWYYASPAILYCVMFAWLNIISHAYIPGSVRINCQRSRLLGEYQSIWEIFCLFSTMSGRVSSMKGSGGCCLQLDLQTSEAVAPRCKQIKPNHSSQSRLLLCKLLSGCHYYYSDLTTQTVVAHTGSMHTTLTVTQWPACMAGTQ